MVSNSHIRPPYYAFLTFLCGNNWFCVEWQGMNVTNVGGCSGGCWLVNWRVNWKVLVDAAVGEVAGKLVSAAVSAGG